VGLRDGALDLGEIHRGDDLAERVAGRFEAASVGPAAREPGPGAYSARARLLPQDYGDARALDASGLRWYLFW
jgi:hypothetical protein